MRTRSRLKKALQLIIFLSITFLIFNELTWRFRSDMQGMVYSKANSLGLQNQENIDVFVLGASSVYCYYQPLEAWNSKGYTSYNYALSSAETDMMELQIATAKKVCDAALYVCDLRGLSSTTEEVFEPSFRRWSDYFPIFSPMRLKGITSYLFKKNWRDLDILSYYIDLIKYHSNYGALLEPNNWSFLQRKTFRNPDKGFFFTGEDKVYPFERPNVSVERGELTDYQQKTINALLDYCDREKLPVLFILCPYIISEDDWRLYNTCADIIRARGYDFVNFNNYYDEIGLDFETDFANTNHVNYLGAEKYTRFLTDYLAAHFDLPDHRGEAAFSEWDQDYQEYRTAQESWRRNISTCAKQHLEARDLGERLPEISDFPTWLEAIQNKCYSLIVVLNGAVGDEIDDPIFNSIYRSALSRWEIDPHQSSYVGVWVDGKRINASGDSASCEGELGMSAGLGTTPCSINVQESVPRIQIGGIDYASDNGGIQVIVFDNYYHKVVDNASILASKGGIRLVHNISKAEAAR